MRRFGMVRRSSHRHCDAYESEVGCVGQTSVSLVRVVWYMLSGIWEVGSGKRLGALGLSCRLYVGFGFWGRLGDTLWLERLECVDVTLGGEWVALLSCRVHV